MNERVILDMLVMFWVLLNAIPSKNPALNKKYYYGKKVSNFKKLPLKKGNGDAVFLTHHCF